METRRVQVDTLPRRPDNQKDRPRNYGPESTFFDKLKGKQIEITWIDDDIAILLCTLLAVDRYTLLIRTVDGREMLAYKAGIALIALSNEQIK